MQRYAVAIGWVLIVNTALFAADNVLTPQEKAKGWVLLFDGKTLNGWDSAVPPSAGGGPARRRRGARRRSRAAQRSRPARRCARGRLQSGGLLHGRGTGHRRSGASHWDVAAGRLSPCGEPAGYLTSKQNYKDFTLTVDFRTGEDTNSGVFIRSPEGNAGYEVQIWKAQPAGYNTGSIVATAKTDRDYKFIPDQWNHYEITADGDHLVVVLNGTKTLDVHDSQFSDGRIRLQYQKFPIEFKNIKLLPIRH